MYRATSADLVRFADVRQGQRIVDLACGTGVTTEEILKVIGPSVALPRLNGHDDYAASV
jgi:ubiquinone/menaquinone biosynthesis C-methylase UbiE